MKTIVEYIKETNYPILKQYELLDLITDDINEGFIDSIKDKVGNLKDKVEKALEKIKKEFGDVVLKNISEMIKIAATKGKKYLTALLTILLLTIGILPSQAQINKDASNEFINDFITATYANKQAKLDVDRIIDFSYAIYNDIATEKNVWSWTGSGIGGSKQEARKNAEEDAKKKWKLNDKEDDKIINIDYIDHFDSINGYGCVAILKTETQNF